MQNKLSNITVLTATFNVHLWTLRMMQSLFSTTEFESITVLDNSDKIYFPDSNEFVNVLDNRNYKNTLNYKNPSKNHCSSLEWAFSQIKTKYVMLCDNDIIFLPKINELLTDYDKYDIIGMIGEDVIPGKRLFPYFCIINLDFIRKNNIHYFNKNMMKNNKNDTGAFFLKSLNKVKPKMKIINLKDYIIHYKNGTLKYEFLGEKR